MKIVPFPKPGDPDDEAFAASVEAALHGEAVTAEAESWRELRADVRGLAAPMSLEFERELRERIELRAVNPSPRAGERRAVHSALARARAWLGSGQRSRLTALAGVCTIAVAIALVLAAPWRASDSGSSSASSRPEGRLDDFVPAAGPVKADAHKHSSSAAASAVSETAAGGEAAAGGGLRRARVQQLGASITLAPKPDEVQSVADEVAQLAARDGGFVQSSNVHVQGRAGEANLTLSLPSARLAAALASLGRIAPMRSESQSLQDITDEYDGDRTKLADAVAERQALLRALAKASAQGEIESLHARLELAAAAITHARGEYQAISKRGSNSAVEVTVFGDAHASESSSTVSKALHDAGNVLKVALAVLVVALAVLVPLAILLAALAVGWRATRRRLRERALS
jgi:Domain of unknown function (DUF4349)